MSEPILSDETKEAIFEEVKEALQEKAAEKLKPFQEWLEEHPVAAFLVAAARRKFRWAKGREMTLQAFKEAIEATRKHRAKGSK
jgi:hypothetical protein